MVTSNPILKALIGWGFLASMLFIIPSGFFLATRILFAWSFDRVTPEFLGSVSERFHTPVNATITIGIILGIMAYLQGFTPFFGYLANIWVILYFIFMLVSISAIIFPYKFRNYYNNSPISNWKLANIPAITIAGIASLIVSIYLEIVTLESPAIGGPISWFSVYTVLVTFVMGAVIYAIFYIYRRRQGIDLSLVFKEVPPA
jgi:amino acid transporter